MADPPSPTAPPPHYAAATSSSHVPPSVETGLDTFFDIVPQADQTSFQVGYLGLQGFRAWIKGDVLIKLDEQARAGPAEFAQCSIALHAIEADQDQSITLFTETQTLWKKELAAAPEQHGSASSSATASRIPATMPFSFALTSDLPHCIHLPTSSLIYRLEATLLSSDQATMQNAFRSTLVHLTRYSRPGPLALDGERNGSAMLGPQTWTFDSPTPIVIQLQRTVFRRAEPICVFIRIPPPERKVLSLGLRSVEANLLRIIDLKRNSMKHELLLAHSGKLCRFHSTRAIVLRLQLHPPFDASNMPYPHPDHDAAQGGPIYGRGGGGGCESVTQDTLLHGVRFLVRINVGIRSSEGVRHDVMCEREVTILPGAAGNEDVDGAHERDAPISLTTAKSADRGNGKNAGEWAQQSQRTTEEAMRNAEPSTSAIASSASSNLVVEDSEEEYDGYEDVGRPLSDTEDRDAAMLLREVEEDDRPPPTLLESQHDVQVEVDVAGVGAGVLRGDVVGHHSESPPDIPGDYVWRTDESDMPPPEEDLLPPPLPLSSTPSSPTSPTRSSFPSGNLGHAVDESRSFLNPVHGDSTADALHATDAHRPPPYMASSMRSPIASDTTRSPDIPSPLTATSTGSTRQATSTDRPGPRGQPAPVRDHGFPPAYAQPQPSPFAASQHPPSYEA